MFFRLISKCLLLRRRLWRPKPAGCFGATPPATWGNTGSRGGITTAAGQYLCDSSYLWCGICVFPSEADDSRAVYLFLHVESLGVDETAMTSHDQKTGKTTKMNPTGKQAAGHCGRLCRRSVFSKCKLAGSFFALHTETTLKLLAFPTPTSGQWQVSLAFLLRSIDYRLYKLIRLRDQR